MFQRSAWLRAALSCSSAKVALLVSKVDRVKLKTNGNVSVDETLVFHGTLSDGSEGSGRFSG